MVGSIVGLRQGDRGHNGAVLRGANRVGTVGKALRAAKRKGLDSRQHNAIIEQPLPHCRGAMLGQTGIIVTVMIAVSEQRDEDRGITPKPLRPWLQWGARAKICAALSEQHAIAGRPLDIGGGQNYRRGWLARRHNQHVCRLRYTG